MADVTISQLNRITPNNGALLPVSQGGVTYSVAPSALLINSGNVGIGTSTPSYKLVVSENGAQGFEVQTSTSTRIDLLTYNRATSLYTDAQLNTKNFIVRTGAGPSVAENLRVDTTGAVTTPNQPAFYGRNFSSPGSTLMVHGGNGNILAFRWSTIDLNTGNCFNNDTGIFTATVAGRYICGLDFNQRASFDKWHGGYIVKNGAFIKYSWFPPMVGNANFVYAPLHVSAIVSMNVNDTLGFGFADGYSFPYPNVPDNSAYIYLLG